jgi:hypothetical protein
LSQAAHPTVEVKTRDTFAIPHLSLADLEAGRTHPDKQDTEVMIDDC